MQKKIYEIDGENFTSLDGFFGEVSLKLIPNAEWGRNFDAFDDILYGGFGTPEGGFVIRWKNSETSKARLGYPETIRMLQRQLLHCHPSNRDRITEEIAAAEAGRGKTIYDVLVDIIKGHCRSGGAEPGDIELELCSGACP